MGLNQYIKKDLIELLCKNSFQYNENPIFKLVSGKMSKYYVNCKPTIMSGIGAFLTGHLVYESVKIAGVKAVGGLTFGADPIAMATAYTSYMQHDPINAFSIRKVKKDHGTGQWIEGDVKSGDSVAIVDDVATTGGSTIKAIERAREEGLQVNEVVILVDRQEGGIENIQSHGVHVSVIINRTELLDCYKLLR